MIPITDVNKSLPMQEALQAGEPVSIPKGWLILRPRDCLVAKGGKALPQGSGDSDRVKLKAG